MKSMVVLFALAAVACGSLVPAAQPPHYPAIVLGPDARPLDTAEVIHARAVHLQAKALEGSYAPLAYGARSAVAPGLIGTPLLGNAAWGSSLLNNGAWGSSLVGNGAWGSPLLASSGLGLAGHGHYLKKRSLGHVAYASPAVSHQSRVDVISSPVVSHAIAAPVLAHAAPVIAAAPAVSHQSRIDVRTSPALVAPGYSNGYAGYSNGYGAYGAYGAGLLNSAPLALGHAW